MDDDAGRGQGFEVKSDRLFTTPIQMIVLCKYSGEPPTEDAQGRYECAYRQRHQHPDEFCLMQFFAADALTPDLITVDPAALVVRRQAGAAEPLAEMSSKMLWVCGACNTAVEVREGVLEPHFVGEELCVGSGTA